MTEVVYVDVGIYVGLARGSCMFVSLLLAYSRQAGTEKGPLP